MMATLIERLEQRATKTGSPAPAARIQIILPDSDADEIEPAERRSDPVEDGLAAIIDYVDARSARSRRRITVRRIETSSDGAVLMVCWCHERRAKRSFRADRVAALIDPESGEIYAGSDGLRRWFEESGVHGFDPATMALDPPPDPAAMKLCRDGIRILMYLARCDGQVVPAEVATVTAYIEERLGAGVNLETKNALLRYATRQYPTLGLFVAAAQNLATSNSGRTNLLQVAAAARRLIEADGTINDEEFAAAGELSHILMRIGHGGADLD